MPAFHRDPGRVCLAVSLVLAIGCSRTGRDTQTRAEGIEVEATERELPPFPPPPILGEHERLITILGTNDMHGGAEMARERSGASRGRKLGGLAVWSGVVGSIRQGLAAQYGPKAGVLLIDAGDQYQGTLLSNSDQGDLMFDVMNLLRYDAAIPGNHGFDFGPVSEMNLESGDIVVTDPAGPENHLGTLSRLSSRAAFPLLGANVYLRSSLVDGEGHPVEVEQVGCQPKEAGRSIDWGRARTPDIFGTHTIREIAGARVAVIGIEHHETPLTTRADNVIDLCFRDEAETYIEVRDRLEGQADVFVLLVHVGDSSSDLELTGIVRELTGGERDLVDAVVAGHTHFTNNVMLDGVAAVQSGSSSRRFGRIDLVWDEETRRVDKSRTRFRGGIALWPAACDPGLDSFCELAEQATSEIESEAIQVAYEGVGVVPDARVVSRIAKARERLARLSDRVLGQATATLMTDRISESPLADRMTDALLEVARSTPIAGAPSSVAFSMLNTGGLRTSIEPGPVTYEELFAVMPFENQAVVVECSADQVVALMRRSIDTCGEHGALIPAGLRVEFRRRDCSLEPGEDNHSELVSVEAHDGSVLYPPPEGASTSSYGVVTLDFLAEGGSGYEAFGLCRELGGLGNLRQLLAHRFEETPFEWNDRVDGRFRDLGPR